jgi:ribosome-binding ATPase
LGLRPWFAFLRRAPIRFFCLRFDIGVRGYRATGGMRPGVTAGDRPARPGRSLGPMERFGFVGLPNAGKSSLYNALTGGGALAAPYAFATTDPNVGVAKVPDDRLDRLAAMSGSKNVVPASVQFTDIGGLVEGASKGEGLGNRFLAGIREVDAVVYVLRAFQDPDVPGPADPLEHLRVVEIELTLADLDALERQVDKKRKAAKGDRSLAAEVAAGDAALAILAEGTPLYRSALSSEHAELLRPYFLLTNKPVLAIVNVDEDQLAHLDDVVGPIADELGDLAPVFGACIQLEAEAAQLDPEDRTEMLEGFGLGEGALPRFLRAAYDALGLRTFFTTGEKESRAWTFRVGSTAPQCAGRIHSDLQRGFIRAEVIAWDELLEIGSWSKAREVGKLRQEGKDYVVSDGDVLEIRFNV